LLQKIKKKLRKVVCDVGMYYSPISIELTSVEKKTFQTSCTLLCSEHCQIVLRIRCGIEEEDLYIHVDNDVR